MKPLRIIVAHNHYQYRGGEDEVVDTEIALLEKNGHMVERYERNNHEIEEINKLDLLKQTLWSNKTQKEIRKLIDGFEPDIIHVHNTLPLISASVYWAAYEAGIPVVQTLHNFRLACPQGMFLYKGKLCEDCLGHFPWRGVVKKCYRESMAQSAAVATMLGVHRILGTYREKITSYIALNNFCKNKFIQAGLPEEKIFIKPNFVDIPRVESIKRKGGLFVGRLAQEKGIVILADALTQGKLQIDVIGVGPQETLLSNHKGVKFLGRQSQEQVYEKMRSAAYLVMPSIWYENFPRTLVEAFACGLPVIASDLGAMAELIQHKKTGLLFKAGSATALSEAMQWAADNPQEMVAMGVNARHEYENSYTANKNYGQLMAIYNEAINRQEEKLCYRRAIG